jgi:hypothetical protein
MMRSASTPAILAILVGGTLATLPAGCRTEQVAIGQQNSGGQTANTTGGAGGGTAKTGGVTVTGGNANSGGGPSASGGSTNPGGTTASGGIASAGGIPIAGGAKASGGATGLGGAGAGGSTGCAPGWTLCCGQCLSPQAGICSMPCLATGGAGPTGGAPNSGGRSGAGGSTVGGSGAGGATGAGGSGAGGTGAGGASGATCGGLRGMSCATNQFCDLPAGSCNVADMTGICVTKNLACATIYQPVCGCNGTTYPSDCDRISAGATKKSDGACATTDAGVCPVGEIWCPGCPSLGVAGGCGQLCPAIACLAPDAGISDAASGSCPSIPPTNSSACGSTNMTCFYDNCPSSGRTQATCTAGTWSVQAGACGTVSCAGPSLLTCPSGQICLITESGAISANCVANSCGQGPVTPACGTTLGSCVVNGSLNAGATITCNTCPVSACP